MLVGCENSQAAFRKFLTSTKNKMIAQSKSHKRPSGQEADEEFERRKQQWQVNHHSCNFFMSLYSGLLPGLL